jgi:predicted metal-dependent hydrolase
VKVVRSPTARSVALRADPARSQVCLVIPKRMSEKTAWKFADGNREWIAGCLAKMEKPVPFVHGAKIPVFGIERTLKIIKTDARTTDIQLTETTLEVRTSREDPSRNIKDYLYKLLMQTIEPMWQGHCKTLKKNVYKVVLRDTHARWGSCVPAGKLMFCWRLVFAPMDVVDYVVAHECAHLVHMNHSDRFWNLCDELSINMEDSRLWLNVYGDKLMMYGLAR